MRGMAGLALISLLLLQLAAAQTPPPTSGFVTLASGPPVKTTYIRVPSSIVPTSSRTGPAVGLPASLLQQEIFATEAKYPNSPCYCAVPVNNQTACFNFNVDTSDVKCAPPPQYSCMVVQAPGGVYTVLAGPVYECTLRSSRTTLASAPQAAVGTVPAAAPQLVTESLPPTAQGPTADEILPAVPPVVSAPLPMDSTLPAPQSAPVSPPVGLLPSTPPPPPVQKARLPNLQNGQLVDINPRPQSAGVQFAGLDIVDNGLLNGLPLEPPNPAICVGNGFVLEATNDALAVYSATNGSILAGPIDYQRFFSVPGPPSSGLSDSYCLYDAADSKRFFVTMSHFNCRSAQCLAQGPVKVFSYLLVGVSKTSDPRDGFLGPYYIPSSGINPTTGDAYPGFEICNTPPKGYSGKGCLGDYPNPGMDANALWFSMNIFTTDAQELVGANAFGVRKADLLSGKFTTPSFVAFTDWAPYPGFTIVPSMTQAGTQNSDELGGAVFLLSSDSFSYTGEYSDADGVPSLRSWAVTNTSLIAQNFPNGASPTLSSPVTMTTEALAFTTTDLANPNALSGTSVPQPTGQILSAQDERMRQVAYSGGLLWSSLNTPARVAGRVFDAFAYFAVKPGFNPDGTYTASIAGQGYVSADGNHLLNSAITATANGSAIITGSLVGNGYYLSAFYCAISLTQGPGKIHVPRISTFPLLNEGPGQLPQRRTGDYSAAVVDEDNKIWVVAEWASPNVIPLQQPDTSNPRIGNWGTYIVQIDPYIVD